MSQITESDVKTEVGEWIDQNWDLSLPLPNGGNLWLTPDSRTPCSVKKLEEEVG